MSKLWSGRTDGVIDTFAEDFNSSISFDKKMYKQDILGSMAHVEMLLKQNIITLQDFQLIYKGLTEILADIEEGKLEITSDYEDIHTFVESNLIARIGDTGKKLHTARSRNDQVALDLRLYLRDKCTDIMKLLYSLVETLNNKASQEVKTIMPGYTHLQRAQPISFSQHLLCYAQMFIRDYTRLQDALDRLNYSPLGSCALAGTTYNTDREFVAKKLGFNGVTQNSMDGVSDRDYCVELLSAFAIIMMHLSRFCEEIILWTSLEFKFVTLSDAFTTGSSIMPQKKNSDMAELIRGKTGRVYGDLMSILTTLKGLPLAYNKDMQEDKECIFDGVETVTNCLTVFIPMLNTMTVNRENMYNSAKTGFINATDLADYITKKGVPFREAYKITGKIVADCIASSKTLEDLTLEEYKAYSEYFDEGLYSEISLETCVEKRISLGGTGTNSVLKQIEDNKIFLQNNK